MGKLDERLEKNIQGLGVMVDGVAKFYPIDQLVGGVLDSWGANLLEIEIHPIDRTPRARWQNGGGPPFQLFTRWYGFAFTFPGCAIYKSDSE